MKAYADAGYPISRAPLDFQEEAMARLETFPDVCSDIKRALTQTAFCRRDDTASDDGKKGKRQRGETGNLLCLPFTICPFRHFALL